MKYRLYVDKKVWITETYEVDIPDSILAEMMDVDGNIDTYALFEYMYYDSDPVESQINDSDIADWSVEKINEQEEEVNE